VALIGLNGSKLHHPASRKKEGGHRICRKGRRRDREERSTASCFLQGRNRTRASARSDRMFKAQRALRPEASSAIIEEREGEQKEIFRRPPFVIETALKADRHAGPEEAEDSTLELAARTSKKKSTSTTYHGKKCNGLPEKGKKRTRLPSRTYRPRVGEGYRILEEFAIPRKKEKENERNDHKGVRFGRGSRSQ